MTSANTWGKVRRRRLLGDALEEEEPRAGHAAADDHAVDVQQVEDRGHADPDRARRPVHDLEGDRVLAARGLDDHLRVERRAAGERRGAPGGEQRLGAPRPARARPRSSPGSPTSRSRTGSRRAATWMWPISPA